MNRNTSVLLNILEAEDRVHPEKLDYFKKLSKDYKLARGACYIGSTSLGCLLVIPLLKSIKTDIRKTQLKLAGPLIGIGFASLYFATSLDYFVSTHYFGKVLSTVKIDEAVYNLIKEECKIDYDVLNKFFYK
jgi:hypothetical protein